MTSQNQTELTSAIQRLAETLEAQHSQLSTRIERIVAAVESDDSVQRLYSRLSAAEARLSGAAERSAQLETLNSELQRLSSDLQAQAEKLTAENAQLKQQINDLEAVAATANAGPAVSAATARNGTMPTRKTLSPAMSALLSKTGINELEPGRIDAAALDRTLGALTVEQRIAVKAEMARAGMIE